MSTIVQSLHRDHCDVERLLGVLEQEREVFYRAEQPDYELVGTLIDHLDRFLHRYLHPKEDLLFNRIRESNAACAQIINDIVNERTKATVSLKALSEAIRDILNEQGVLRRIFDAAARSFIRHQRRQIEMEEQQLFPIARSVLLPAEWADLHATLRDETVSLRVRQLKGQLRDEFRWIIREGSADRAERTRMTQAGRK